MVTVRPVLDRLLDIRIEEYDEFYRHVSTVGVVSVYFTGPYMGVVSSSEGDSVRAVIKKFWPDVTWA